MDHLITFEAIEKNNYECLHKKSIVTPIQKFRRSIDAVNVIYCAQIIFSKTFNEGSMATEHRIVAKKISEAVRKLQ